MESISQGVNDTHLSSSKVCLKGLNDNLAVMECFLFGAQTLHSVSADMSNNQLMCEEWPNKNLVCALYLCRHAFELGTKALRAELFGEESIIHTHNLKKLWENPCPSRSKVIRLVTPKDIDPLDLTFFKKVSSASASDCLENTFNVLESNKLLTDEELFRYASGGNKKLTGLGSFEKRDIEIIQSGVYFVRQSVLACIHLKKFPDEKEKAFSSLCG